MPSGAGRSYSTESWTNSSTRSGQSVRTYRSRSSAPGATSTTGPGRRSVPRISPGGSARGCPPASALARALPFLDEELIAAVLGPARLVVLGAGRALLAVRDDGDSVALHALGHQVIHGGLGAAVTEGEVVVVRAALVGVPLDEEQIVRIGVEPLRARVQDLGIARTHRRLVEGEVDRLERVVGLILLRRRRARRLWSRRRGRRSRGGDRRRSRGGCWWRRRRRSGSRRRGSRSRPDSGDWPLRTAGEQDERDSHRSEHREN